MRIFFVVLYSSLHTSVPWFYVQLLLYSRHDIPQCIDESCIICLLRYLGEISKSREKSQ